MRKKEDIIARILKCPSLKHMDEEDILKNFEGLIELLIKIDAKGDEIFYIICGWMEILTYPTEVLKKNIDDLIKFGFDKAAIKRMAKDDSHSLVAGIETFETALNNFRALGVTKEEFLKMAKNTFDITKYTFQELIDKRADFMSLNFTEKDFKTMVTLDASILTVRMSTVEAHMKNLGEYDYSEEEIRTIIVGFPNTVLRDIDTIREKLDAVSEIGIKHAYVASPNRLRQSAHLTRAKAQYLTNHYISLTSQTGINYIFSCSEKFKRAFGVDNRGVEALYDLELELKEKRLRLEQKS